MKAIILAAGYGKRLLPLTKIIPKCMIEIKGKPLIEHQIRWLLRNGITEVAVNLHHLPDKISYYLGDGSRLGAKITYSHEKDLLGTAGGTKKIEKFFDDDFLVFYGDEYTNLDISELKKFHDSKKAFMTVCIREKISDKKHSNLIVLDGDSRITRFIEKPRYEEENLSKRNFANCGIYICNRKLLDKIPENAFSDFGYDILPGLVAEEKVYGFIIPCKFYWCEMGRLEKYFLHKNEIEAFL